jgi:hypothetical protein
MTKAQVEQLESLVDASTLAVVVNTLAIIAREKAAHIRENWQDQTTAQTWDQAAGLLETAARRISAKGV